MEASSEECEERGADASMSVQMSSAVGRAEGSSWRHAFTARSTSGGHSSGTLRAHARPFRQPAGSIESCCILLL